MPRLKIGLHQGHGIRNSEQQKGSTPWRRFPRRSTNPSGARISTRAVWSAVLQYLIVEYPPLTFPSSSATAVPLLDEGSFQRLLEAAYVVQQHNDTLRAREARLETSQILTQIAEIQSLAETCSLDIAGVCALAVDRLRKMTDAAAVSIGLVTDGHLDCVAEAGVPARIAGSSLASHSIVATERLKSGEMFESDNAESDIRLDVTLCREQKTGSLIAAPVHRFGELSGLVEARWEHAKAFQKGDSRACRLVAELITTTLEGDSSSEARAPAGSAAPEVSTDSTPAAGPATLVSRADGAEPREANSLHPEESGNELPDRCRVCGKVFGADEVFCGNCSLPRLAAVPATGLQSKWASMWYMQQAHDSRQPGEENYRTPVRWLVPSESMPTESKPTESKPTESKPAERKPAEPTPPAEEITRSVWTRANDSGVGDLKMFSTQSIAIDLDALDETEKKSVLAHVSQPIGALGRHPIAAGIGAVLMFLMLSLWAFSPAPGNPQITRLESILVELGLAEVPAPTSSAHGRPDARVWLDVHTALYYCEGSELYGKTPEGRFTTQGEAQQDQFEPASQSFCE